MQVLSLFVAKNLIPNDIGLNSKHVCKICFEGPKPWLSPSSKGTKIQLVVELEKEKVFLRY